MIVGLCSDVGKIRNVNQDSFYRCELKEFPLFVVADGMGGHKAGEIASQTVIETVKEMINTHKEQLMENTLDITKFIKDTLSISNNKVYEKSNSIEEYKGMGTTVTMAFINNYTLYIGHIGDSRAYLLRESNLIQLTQDHSLVAELVRNGSITEKEAINHPQKNIITRALGTDNEIEIDISSIEIQDEDIILLCSDGLTNMVSDELIKEIILKSDDIQNKCNSLIDTANEFGGLDNITAILIEVGKEKR